MSLSTVEKALLVATYFRGRIPLDWCWRSSSDQILILSLFYTGEITDEDCARRFATRSYVDGLYDEEGDLTEEIWNRYLALQNLLRKRPDLLQSGGDFVTPAGPTYTACGLTEAGTQLALSLVESFPKKPDFPNWPDRRADPNQ